MYYRKNDKVIKGDHVENFELSGSAATRSFNLLKIFLAVFLFVMIMMFDISKSRSIRDIMSEPSLLLIFKAIAFTIALVMLFYC